LNNLEDKRNQEWTLKQKLASLILLERAFIIFFAFFYPLLVLSSAGINIFFGYIIFLILGIFLFYYFVISNKLLQKKKLYFQITFPLSTGIFLFIVLNQILAFISDIVYASLNIFNIIFFIFTVFFVILFFYNIRDPNFLRFNQFFLAKVRKTSDKNHIRINLSLVSIFSILFLINYILPVFSFTFPARQRDDFQMGFWTYGAPLDNQAYVDTGIEPISNTTLQYMGAHNVYITWGITQTALDSENATIWPRGFLNGNLNFTERLQRCKDYGVKVHICINHIYSDKPYTFANIWTIEDTINDIYQLKTLLEAYNLWGDPVDTLVFDIEPVIPYYLSFYGLINPELGDVFSNMDKLNDYDEILQHFKDSVDIFVDDWGMDVELCHIGMDMYDDIDGDDDLHRIWGLIDAETNENVQRSYMIYRGDLLSQKFLVDSMSMMNTNDIVIISAFEKGEFYYNNLDLAINDGLLVKNYPTKDLHLEVWCAYRFIVVFGESSIINYINGIEAQSTSTYSISNIFSLINDALYFFYIYIDLFFSGLLFIIKMP